MMNKKNGCDEEMVMNGEYNLGTHTPSTVRSTAEEETDSSKELGSDEATVLS